MMLTSAPLKSQRDSVKGREVDLWEAGREMSVADGWLAGFWKHDDSSLYPENSRYRKSQPRLEGVPNCMGACGDSTGEDIGGWRWRGLSWLVHVLQSHGSRLQAWLPEEAL